MRMITAVRCPKCKKKGAERRGLAEGKSLWRCPPCGNEFEVQILKFKKEG